MATANSPQLTLSGCSSIKLNAWAGDMWLKSDIFTNTK